MDEMVNIRNKKEEVSIQSAHLYLKFPFQAF